MRPETEADLADAITAAKGPLHVQGGGTRSIGRPVTGDVLQTGGLSGISLYEPGALTMVVRAGTPLAEVEAALEGERQRLPFEPMDHRALLGTTGEPTIGGMVASNASGPRRIQVGACRDFMLGVRFVDGQGSVVKNGGRVMKNVTGYDLVKLLSGSWGTLGVLSEVSLKVLPIPDSAACIMLHGLGEAEAVAAMARALGSPFEINGAAHLPAGLDEDRPLTLLRIEGFEASVAYRAGEIRGLFSDCEVSVETDPARVARIWTALRDVEMMKDQPGDVWRISVKPSDAPDLISRIGAEAVLMDWGGGLIWARMPAGRDLRACMGETRGHATLVRATSAGRSALPVFHPEPAPLARISSGLRQRFDPRGVLNPGLMGA